MRGDHDQRSSVLSSGSGTIVFSWRPTEDFNIENYRSCPECLYWMGTSEIQRHQKTSCLALIPRTTEEKHCSSASNTKFKSDTLKGKQTYTPSMASNLLQK